MTKIIDVIENTKAEKAKIGSTPYVEIGDIDIKTKKIIEKEKPSVAGSIYAPSNSIIVSKVRPTRGAITLIDKQVVVSGGFSVLKVNEKICNPKFLFYQLAWNQEFLAYLGSRSVGLTYPTVKEKDILEYELHNVPSLKEQELIVSVLEEAEELKRKRAEVDQKMTKTIPALFNKMFSKKDWPVKTVGEVAGIIVPTRDKPRSFTGTIPWVTLPDVDGFFIDTSKNKLTHEEADNVSNRLMPKGTVLLSCAATLGKVVVASTELYANQQFYGLVANRDLVDPVFLAVSLQIKGENFYSRLGGMSTLGFFSKQKALEIKIDLPPVSLQNEFAKNVEDILDLEGKQKKSAKEIEGLFSSVLSRSFSIK